LSVRLSSQPYGRIFKIQCKGIYKNSPVFQAIGNNYNQVTKALKSTFTEKKALAFLYKLEKATMELVALNQKIIDLTKEFEEKWLQK
jgi:hypothetical protein